MRTPYKSIPFALFSEWELPQANRFQFEYENVDGMKFIVINFNIRDFLEDIRGILGTDGAAYLYMFGGKKHLYVGHPDKTYVRFDAWTVEDLEPWTFATPFLWLKDKIVNLFKR